MRTEEIARFSLFLFSLSLITILLNSSVIATKIYASNRTGYAKTLFYTNESVYVFSDNNVTTNSSIVDIYIINDVNYWTDGAYLSDLRVHFISITSDSRGYLNGNTIWQPTLPIGDYDIVADRDRDGYFNNSRDYVCNLSYTGVSVRPTPASYLSVSYSEYNPISHKWNIVTNGSTESLIMAIKASTTSIEDIVINGIYLKSAGTGNDKTGVDYVKVVWDMDNNGSFDSTDQLLGIDKYSKDNGMINFDITNNNPIVHVNSSMYLLFFYSMNKSDYTMNGTFYFDLVQILANGLYSDKIVEVSGFPIKSAIRTVEPAPANYSSSTTAPSGSGSNTTTAPSTAASSTTDPPASTTTTPASSSVDITALLSSNIAYIVIFGAVVIIGALVFLIFGRRLISGNGSTTT